MTQNENKPKDEDDQEDDERPLYIQQTKGELIKIIKKLEEKLEEEKLEKKIIFLPATKTIKTIGPEDLHVYMIKLGSPAKFEDTEKHEFSRFVLVTKRPFEEEFGFSEMPLWFDDLYIELNGQASGAWFIVLDWITDDIPILFSIFTEKDCEEFIDASINAEAIKNIKEKALTRIYYQARSFLKRFDLEIDELKSWNEMNMKKNERLVQKIENELAKKSEDPYLDMDKTIKLTKPWLYGLCAGWFIAFGLFMAIIF